MSLNYKKILVIGATSGIGYALSARFVETGTSVVVVGRRKENLDKFVSEYGSAGKVDSAVFDITDLAKIPTFVADIFSKHPDIDSVFLNSGVQRHLDWTKPEEIDLGKIDLEVNTNYISYLHFTKAVLPYLTKQAPKETAIWYSSSGLALVPIISCPNYCATKAALHSMLLVLRQQLKDVNSNVKIVELFPPAVQTELHDAKHQPEFGDKGKHIGMPLADFVDEAFAGLVEGKDEVAVQLAKTAMGWSTWEQDRQKNFHKMVEIIKNRH